MKSFSFFRKPDWQSPDAERRAAAVAVDDSADLLAALPRLAVEDPDAGVRRQALRRCNDPALFSRAARDDSDAGLRSWAREQWLAAIQSGRLACDDAQLHALAADEREKLAIHATDEGLRGRALATIDRQAFLAERILADGDSASRLALIARIESPAALDRLAEQLRRKSKQLHRAAVDRAEQLRLASGDDATRARLADAVCADLERLMRDPADADSRRAKMDQASARWQALAPESLTERLRTRFEGALAVLRVQLQPPAPAPVAPAEPESVEPAPVPTAEELAAQAKLDTEIARNRAERELEQQRQREQADRDRQELQERQRASTALVEQLAKAVDAGESAKARDLAAKVDGAQLSEATQGRWNDLQPALKELLGWEAWAGNKVRARLCAEVEKLIGSGLHPDAISSRIQEIQQQWRGLDSSEGRNDDSPASGLDKRLRVAVARALKPAREFFDKRRELRNEHRDALSAFLAEAEKSLSEEAPVSDLSHLLGLQKQSVEHLRSLDQQQGGDRKRLGRRLRELLDAIKPRVEAAFAGVEEAKQSLIAAAQALVGESDRRRVAGEAKSLNERWKQAGKGRTGRDQAQWRQFRAALDQAFGHLDQQRQTQNEQQQQRREAAEALVVEAEALARLDGEQLSGSEAASRALRERWQALSVRDGDLAERYDNALTLHREAIKANRQDQQRERLLAMLETTASPEAAVPASSNDSVALELVFEAEAMVGIEVPEAERETRRQWQLRRLQDHLRGAGGGSGNDPGNLEALLTRWRELAPALDQTRVATLRERLRQVVLRFRGG